MRIWYITEKNIEGKHMRTKVKYILIVLLIGIFVMPYNSFSVEKKSEDVNASLVQDLENGIYNFEYPGRSRRRRRAASPPAALGGTGIGLKFGTPTGLTLKFAPFEFGLGGWEGFEGDIFLNVDYLIGLTTFGPGIDFYCGIGGIIGFGDPIWLGPRGLFGFEFMIPSTPLGVFLDLGGNFFLIEDTEFEFLWQLGIRFYL